MALARAVRAVRSGGGMFADGVVVSGADVLAARPATANLAVALERIGWQINCADFDLVDETARIELRRGNLAVTFDARNGKASITREFVRTDTVKVGRRGDSFRADRIRHEFMGRTRGLGMRSGLRVLSDYVADNAPMQITRDQARNIFRPLLVAPAISSATGETK